jgi:hypothetical protein
LTISTPHTLRKTSIKSLYTLALAEDEGVGTAYEYYAKRLVLRPWLKTLPAIKRLLVAGLPQKYGSSLDHLYLAEELGAEVVVVDERADALEKLQQSLVRAQEVGWLTAVAPHTIQVEKLSDLSSVAGLFDLAIANEVLQRLPDSECLMYLREQSERATAVAIFCPNAQNPDHAAHSGLGTLHLNDLKSLMLQVPNYALKKSGYIDMPPFPTGVSRSEEQRVQADSGKGEALAMWGLNYFAQSERLIPGRIRQQKSHIIYTLSQP